MSRDLVGRYTVATLSAPALALATVFINGNNSTHIQ